jgi:hypothetical protein
LKKQETVDLWASAGAFKHVPNWETIDWSKAQTEVKRLQRRIAQAVREKRWGKDRVLCRILTRSQSAKWLAVRRVITNKGARSPGVDHILWKTSQQYWEAAQSLTRRGYRAQPLRRVYVVKRNGRWRPLGIPTMKDRAMQALYALALAPIVESRADPNSYGFRPYRSTHDAIEQLVICLSRRCSGLVPHSTLTVGGSDWKRRPAGPAIKGYYPQVIDEDTFLRVQTRGSGPKGPLCDRGANLFQGLLKDGDHPEFSMWYKNHGDKAGKWVYVISDYRRVHPEEQIFSWPYGALERLILNYLVDMDWTALTAGRDAETQKLKKELEIAEARATDLGRQLKKLVELAKLTGDVEEVAGEVRDVRSRRDALRAQAGDLRHQLAAKQDFSAEDASALIRGLASDTAKLDSRKRLREAIRA